LRTAQDARDFYLGRPLPAPISRELPFHVTEEEVDRLLPLLRKLRSAMNVSVEDRLLLDDLMGRLGAVFAEHELVLP